ncbi:hypothetical protein Peur_071254 [Populus x canadensis]
MAASVSTVGAGSRGLCFGSSMTKKQVSLVQLNLKGAGSGPLWPTSAFFDNSLKTVLGSKITNQRLLTRNLKLAAEYDKEKQPSKDKWKGLAFDTSDDQQDITRGKGMVDSLFQAPMGTGTHYAVMSSYDYTSKGLRHPIVMSAGELESGNAGEPAKLIRQRYREAADIIKKRGKMCCLFINDLDAGAGRFGGTTQYTVNNQMVNATLMNIADNPTSVQLPGMYNKEENPRVPIIVTGNDFSTLYAPLIRDGRMEKFYWAPTREDRIGVCTGIFGSDNVPREDIVKLVNTFHGQSIDFFGALRARAYDDEVRKWISGVGVENVGKRLVNSKEGPPTLEQPKMTLEKLLEYGNMLVLEQDNVKRVRLSDKYLKEAALGDANEDAMKNGSFYG